MSWLNSARQFFCSSGLRIAHAVAIRWQVGLEFCEDSAGLECANGFLTHMSGTLMPPHVCSLSMRSRPLGPLQVDPPQQGSWTSHMVRAHSESCEAFLRPEIGTVPFPSHPIGGSKSQVQSRFLGAWERTSQGYERQVSWSRGPAWETRYHQNENNGHLARVSVALPGSRPPNPGPSGCWLPPLGSDPEGTKLKPKQWLFPSSAFSPPLLSDLSGMRFFSPLWWSLNDRNSNWQSDSDWH